MLKVIAKCKVVSVRRRGWIFESDARRIAQPAQPRPAAPDASDRKFLGYYVAASDAEDIDTNELELQ